jgi:hypothetical protein
MNSVSTYGRGTKVLLVAGGLLLVDLFLTWQSTQVDFGPNGTVTSGLDGWDFWGLVIGVSTLAVVALAVLREHDDGLMFDARWSRAVLALGLLVLVVAVLKNVRDTDSTWAGYLGVLLAGAVAVGGYLSFTYEREARATEPAWHTRDRTQERPTARSQEQQASDGKTTTPRW